MKKTNKEKIAFVSILANLSLAGSKIFIGIFSHSSAVLASGIDSFSDIISSVIGFIGIKISKKPADKEHPYGHHKFEVLAGFIITLIVFVAGIGIIYDAYKKFLSPTSLNINYWTFGVMIFSVLVNEIMSRLKIYYGKKENSISLLSDGFHSRIDVYTSLAILVSLLFSKYWIYFDLFLACFIGLYIIKTSFSLGKEAVDCLLDVAASPEIENKIKEIAQNENIKIDSLKTQKKGSAISASLEISLPDSLSVKQATKISNNLREKLMNGVELLQYISIQISSHEVENNFYQPKSRQGFGWQKKGKFKDDIEEAVGKGPEGYCVCKKCGYKIKHQRKNPCATLECPHCHIKLERQ
jgi:cation diffusion facilitator family transporter